MQLFSREAVPAAPPDTLTEARATVDKLAAALAKAESESADARITYDRQMHEYVARRIGKDQPSQDPQRAAEAKVDSLKRLLGEARAHLERLTNEFEGARRLEAIHASGGEVARLTATAEQKLVEFEAATATLRRAEMELAEILFSNRTGLRQQFADPQAQRDANWTRTRLRQRIMAIGDQTHCLVDASFDADSGNNLATFDPSKLYQRAASARA